MSGGQDSDFFSLRATVVAATEDVQSRLEKLPPVTDASPPSSKKATDDPPATTAHKRPSGLWLGGFVATRDTLLQPIEVAQRLFVPTLLAGLWSSQIGQMTYYLAAQVPNATVEQEHLLLIGTILLTCLLCSHAFGTSARHEAGQAGTREIGRIFRVAFNLALLLLLVISLTIAILVAAFIVIQLSLNAALPPQVTANDEEGIAAAALIWCVAAVALITPVSFRLVSRALSTRPTWRECWRRSRGHRLDCAWIVFTSLALGIVCSVLLQQCDICYPLFQTDVEQQYVSAGFVGALVTFPLLLTCYAMGKALARFNRAV